MSFPKRERLPCHGNNTRGAIVAGFVQITVCCCLNEYNGRLKRWVWSGSMLDRPNEAKRDVGTQKLKTLRDLAAVLTGWSLLWMVEGDRAIKRLVNVETIRCMFVKVLLVKMVV